MLKRKPILMNKITKNSDKKNDNIRFIQKKDGDKDILKKGQKKIITFTGLSGKGKTVVIDLLAETFSKNKIKTSVLDFTSNRGFWKNYCWLNDEKSDIQKNALLNYDKTVLKINKYYFLYTSEELPTFNFKIIDTIKKNSDVILIDCDLNSDLIDKNIINIYNLSDAIYCVHDINIRDILELKKFMNDLGKYTTIDKINILINKDIGIKDKIIFDLINYPIKQLEDNNMNFSLKFKNDILKLNYDEQIYLSDNNRIQFYGGKLKCNNSTLIQLQRLAQTIL